MPRPARAHVVSSQSHMPRHQIPQGAGEKFGLGTRLGPGTYVLRPLDSTEEEKRAVLTGRMSGVTKIHAREILDSRGNPTVEVNTFF